MWSVWTLCGSKFCLVRGMSEVVSPEVFWPAKVEGCKRFSVSGVCEKREVRW